MASRSNMFMLATTMLCFSIASAASPSPASVEQNNTDFVSGSASPPIAKLLTCSGVCGADKPADYAAQRLRCPTCDDFGKSNVDDLRLQETCSPANDPLDVPTVANFFSEPLNFTLEAGEYAEITTINPGAKRGAKSCLKDSCQAKLEYSFYYSDHVSRRRNMDGTEFDFSSTNTKSVFTNDFLADSCKHFDADGATVRKANHWCYVGGISSRPRTFFASVKSTGNSCAGGIKLRVKKHTYVKVPSTNNIKNQGVQCMDLVSNTGLDGGELQDGSSTAPYVNVTQMYRRKWPNASNIRWWVQSKPVTTGTGVNNIKVGDQCDGDMTKDTCKNTKPADKKTICKFEYVPASFPANFYRPGQLIGFKEPYKCAADQPNPGTTDCTTDTCTKYWGEMTKFFGEAAPTNNDGYIDALLASRPTSVFGTLEIATRGTTINSDGSTTSWFTVNTNNFQPTGPGNHRGWTVHQVCPSAGTEIIHVPTEIEGNWFPSSTDSSPTELKVMHSGASWEAVAGSRPTASSIATWAAADATNAGPYVQMYRGTGAYDEETMMFYDDANVAKSFFGEHSVAHVDCGLMPCPTSHLQICSRIICPSGTTLDDAGDCVLCPTSAAGNTYIDRANMNPFQGDYYSVDTVTCDACDDKHLNYAEAESLDAVITYNKGITVEGPEFAKDPTKRTTCAIDTCTTGSSRSLITKNVGECTICGKGSFRGGATAKIENEEIRMKLHTGLSVAVTDPDTQLVFAKEDDKRIYVSNLASKKGGCEAKSNVAATFIPICTLKTNKAECLAVEDKTCTVEAGGTNAACAAANANKDTCADADTVNTCAVKTGGANTACAAITDPTFTTCAAANTGVAANDCEFTAGGKCVFADTGSACDYTDPSFFPDLGNCKAKTAAKINTCKAANADKGTCLDILDDKKCTVKASGTNGACAAANADSATCLAAGATKTAANACVFTSTNACDYIEPANGGKIRLLPADKPTVPVSLSSDPDTCLVKAGGTNADCVAVVSPTIVNCQAATTSGNGGNTANDCVFTSPEKKYRFDDAAMFLEVGDKFKINRPQCSDSDFTTEVACTTKGKYKDICLDNSAGGTGKPYANGRETTETACEADAATWSATGKCYKAKVSPATVFSVPLEDGREDRQVDCEAVAGTWSSGLCSNVMYTSEDACTNVGTWIYCTDTTYTSEASCTRKGAWTISQCVSEDDCELILGAAGGRGGNGEPRCEKPKGTWSAKKLETEYTVANGYCYEPLEDKEPTMAGKEFRKKYGRVCGKSYDWFGSSEQVNGESGSKGKCWEYVALDGVATNELKGERKNSEVLCEEAVGVWTPASSTQPTASCDKTAYTTKDACEKKGTWSKCSNTHFTDEGGCELTKQDSAQSTCVVKALGTNVDCDGKTTLVACNTAGSGSGNGGDPVANACVFTQGWTSTPFHWYGLGNGLKNNCYVKKGGSNIECRKVVNPTTGSCATATTNGNNGNDNNDCVFTSGAATLIPLIDRYTSDSIDVFTTTTDEEKKRNLYYNAEVRYGFYGPNSCESCPSGLSIWSVDPDDHDSTSKCKTCPKGYVGLSTAASCSTCKAGTFDSRSTAQQDRVGPFATCSGKTGDKACDSSQAENCATCPLGRTTFSHLLAIKEDKTVNYLGNKDDCRTCPTGYHYKDPQTITGSSPSWDSEDCSTCPLSAWRSFAADTCAVKDGGTNTNCAAANANSATCLAASTGVAANACVFTPVPTKDILKMSCTTCPHGWGYTKEDLQASSRDVMLGTEKSACLDKKSTTCPPGQVGVVTYEGGECAAKDVVQNPADSSNCTTCPPNTYTFGDQRKCSSCPAGKVIPADVDFDPKMGTGNFSFYNPFSQWKANSAHHFSSDACAVDIQAVAPGTCANVGPRAQEYHLGFNEVGEHWITFVQSPLHALQLGTCCVGADCENEFDDETLSTEQKDFLKKGFKGEWQVVSENSHLYPTVNKILPWKSTTIRRSPTECLFPYDNCNKGDPNAYRIDLVNGLIPKSIDGLGHRMWAKFKCLDPLGCAHIGTTKLSNKQMPEDPLTWTNSDATNKILRYKVAAVGCLPGEGLLGGNCTQCPAGYVSPYVGPALDSGGSVVPVIPTSCTSCEAGKKLPDGSALPKFNGLELLECAFHLEGKTSDGNQTYMKCPHVGFEKTSDVFYVTQEVGEVIYLGTRFCGANRCTQFLTEKSCETGTRSTDNAFKYQADAPSSQCLWSPVTNQCVARLKSSLSASEVSSPPKKIRDRSTLNYIRKLQKYDGDGEFYQDGDGVQGLPASRAWPDRFQDPENVKNLGYEYVMKLEAVQYRRNVFVQAKCLDPLGCPGLRVSVEARGCASGSYGRAPNCAVCPANSYGTEDAAPVGLSADKACTQCPTGKSISALALPAQRSNICACQNGWPMESPAVSSIMAEWCPTAVLRAKNVLPMMFKLPNRTMNKPKPTTYTSFQIVQRAGTILRFTPIETILPPAEPVKVPEPDKNNYNKESGRPVSLSADGSTVAIGAPSNDDNSGVVRIYEMKNGNWTQVGQDIEGDPTVEKPVVNPVIIRYDQDDTVDGFTTCGKAPIPQAYSHQLKSLQMWAGDISSIDGTEQSQLQNCMPRAHNVDFEVQGSRSNRVQDDPGIADPLGPYGICTVKAGSTFNTNNCLSQASQASKTKCMSFLEKKCTVKAGGTNTNCAAANADSATCLAASTGVAANACVFTSKQVCEYKGLNSDSMSVPGVLTVGSSCNDRVIYFHAEADDCYGTHGDADGCEVIIEVTEEVVDKCITARTTRNATVSAKSFVPVLGTYDITVNATIYARCVSQFRVGTLGAERLKKVILSSFTDRKTTGQRCIGSGAACLVDQANRFDGVSGIAVDFADYMNQTLELPNFCDPDDMYYPVTQAEMNRRTPTTYDVVTEGPGLRVRPSDTYLSPKAFDMWGAFQNSSHQAVSSGQKSARRRMEAIGEYFLDWHDYMQNGADHVGTMKAAYHGESTTTTATTDRNHVAMRERRQLHEQHLQRRRRLAGTTDGAAQVSVARAAPISIETYVDPSMSPTFAQKKDHLYSAVSLTFTVRNVRAANRMWAEALVKDILGEQEVPKNNARPKYVVNKTSPWWERDNNAGIYDGVYDLPVFTERPCGVAENMARALKSTNNMRPTFRWASVVLTIDNAEDTYVDCGFSPVEIFFIVVGSLLAFVLLCALIFNVGFRRRGSCGGNPNGTFIGCYGGLACCSLCPGFLGILFCCCSFCPCKKENNKDINKNSSKKPPMLSNVSPKKSSAPNDTKKKGGLCGCCSKDKKQKLKSDNKLLSNSQGSSKEAKEKESTTSEIALSTLSSEKKKKRKTASNNPMVNVTAAPATAAAAPATAVPATAAVAPQAAVLKTSATPPPPRLSQPGGPSDKKKSQRKSKTESELVIHIDPKTKKRYTSNKRTGETKWLDT